MLARSLGLEFGIVQRTLGETAATASIYAAGGIAIDALGIERRRDRPLDHRAQWMLLPPSAPAWATDPSELWRRAGAAERQFNAQEARTLDITLPRELPASVHDEFVRFVFAPFIADGLPVQVDLHIKPARDGRPNPHIHAVAGTRPLGAEGFAKSKRPERRWNSLFWKEGPGGIRDFIATRMNEFFELHRLEVRVDPRSNLERGLPPPEETLPRYLVRDPKTENAKAALARRDETRVCRQDYRDACDEVIREDEQIERLTRLIEDAEHRAVRMRCSVPVDEAGFPARCESVASAVNLTFVVSGPLCRKVEVGAVSLVVHPDRIVVDGTPADDDIAAIAKLDFGQF